MTNYSNDLGLSRCILRDLMFCLDDKVRRDKASVYVNLVAKVPVCKDRCRIVMVLHFRATEQRVNDFSDLETI